MTADFLFRLIVGHFIGDYFFQTNKMALNKKENVWWCLVHCLIYTLIVGACIYPEWVQLGLVKSTIGFGIIFISHFIIDRTNIINWWLHKIGSRSYQNAFDYYDNAWTKHAHRTLFLSYTAIVQTVADNTAHLVLMYIGFKLLFTV